MVISPSGPANGTQTDFYGNPSVMGYPWRPDRALIREQPLFHKSDVLTVHS